MVVRASACHWCPLAFKPQPFEPHHVVMTSPTYPLNRHVRTWPLLKAPTYHYDRRSVLTIEGAFAIVTRKGSFLKL